MFSTNSEGVILNKPKGKIQYYFKGIAMHPESATAVLSSNNILTVLRDSDGQTFDFVFRNSKWLSKNHSNKSLLYGTQFVFDK